VATAANESNAAKQGLWQLNAVSPEWEWLCPTFCLGAIPIRKDKARVEAAVRDLKHHAGAIVDRQQLVEQQAVTQTRDKVQRLQRRRIQRLEPRPALAYLAVKHLEFGEFGSSALGRQGAGQEGGMLGQPYLHNQYKVSNRQQYRL
jgi:hypothetical protein